MSNDALYVNEQASNDGSRLRFNRAKRGAPRPKPDSQRPRRPKSIIQERRHKEQILSHCFFSSPASTRWSLWSGSTGQDRHEAEWRENSKSEFGMDKVQTGELLKYEAVSLTSQTFRLFAFSRPLGNHHLRIWVIFRWLLYLAGPIQRELGEQWHTWTVNRRPVY